MIPMTLAQIADVVGGVVGSGLAGGRATDGAVDCRPVDRLRVDAPTTIDSRTVDPGGLFAALAGDSTDGHEHVVSALQAGAVAALVSRPVDVPHILVADVTHALGRLAHHVHQRLRDAGLTTIALTGSAGKTSTKDLLAQVLEAAGPTVSPEGSFNNELGVPLTVLRADADTRHLVVEMGARGPGHVALLCDIVAPSIGLVLNVGTAHVGEFGTVDDIARAKGELIEALPADGVAVLNADDPRVVAMAERTRARLLMFGAAAPHAAGVRLEHVELTEQGQPRITLRHAGHEVTFVLPQPGLHHGSNAAGAAAAAIAAGLTLEQVADRLADAAARSPHRMARHDLPGGITVVDDSYNANPESMTAALRWLAAVAPGRGIAVVGEMLELGAESVSLHRTVGELAAQIGLARVVAVGTGAAPVAEAAGTIGLAVNDVDGAVDALTGSLRSGDVVLVKASRGCRLERVVDDLVSRTRHTADGR